MAIPGVGSLGLGLSLGGGPSQAISNAGPNVAQGWTGPFVVGKGSATQTTSLPSVSNSSGNGQTGSPFTTAGLFENGNLLTALLVLAAVLFYRKKA